MLNLLKSQKVYLDGVAYCVIHASPADETLLENCLTGERVRSISPVSSRLHHLGKPSCEKSKLSRSTQGAFKNSQTSRAAKHTDASTTFISSKQLEHSLLPRRSCGWSW
jgi:hypothetical protein